MSSFAIYNLALGDGRLGLCPLPGGKGDYNAELGVVQDWRPDLVVSMTTSQEMQSQGAMSLGADLAGQGILWRHMPVADFGVPDPAGAVLWPEISALAHDILKRAGRVLVHCKGGCGRSGMVVLRLMVEAGEDPAEALARLRNTRPCAVETTPQELWAAEGAVKQVG